MRIELRHITRSLILLVLTLVISPSAGATDLSGKVTEVIDGNTINLKSLSHTIKVRLLAVAPPEKSQPYAEVARKHLSDLILGKYVVVRYTGIGEQGYLVGRIVLEQADINAQMLRDGVAWYYRPDASDLAEADRQLYPACENAARSERRGLWQDQSPVAPWDFKKSQLVVPSVNPTPPPERSQSHVQARNHSELTNDDLMSGVVGSGTAKGQPNVRKLSTNAAPGSWVTYEPADRHFSVLTPADGVEIARPIIDENGQEVEFHYIVGSCGPVFCSLTWARGPNNNYTDASVVTHAWQSFLKGVNFEVAKKGGGLAIVSQDLGMIRVADYVGREFTLRAGEGLGIVRILSKQIGDKRELLVLAVMNKNLDEASANQFLNSLKINTKSQINH